MEDDKKPTVEIKTSIDIGIDDRKGVRTLLTTIAKIIEAGGTVRVTVESLKSPPAGT